MEAVIFIGIQGSGKSTFYQERFFATHVRISLDLLKTRARERDLLDLCLRSGQPFVVDNTNVRASDRAPYIEAAKRAGFRVEGYLFETDLREAIRRNNGRSGKAAIPVPGVVRAFKALERPTYGEAFDRLYVVSPGADGRFEVTPCEETPRTSSQPAASSRDERRRIFLLSPANAGGDRARLLLRTGASFELAVRLRQEGVPLGEAFSFVSGLYFRGKLAYALTFAAPPEGIPGSWVITSSQGLLPPETIITQAHLEQIASVPIDATDARYREPLERGCRTLHELAGPSCDFILLGSVATIKYLEPMFTVFGDRLLFPQEFVGRGDMSRGGLLLRCARAGVQLTYVPVGNVTRHGPRPPKLPRLPRR
jgi:predicted kinase